jgi:ketosteroid isomerase-like protein
VSASETAWSYFDLLTQGRIDEALDLLDDEGTFWNVRTRRTTPIPEMRPYIRSVFESVPMKFTLHDAIEGNDRAALEVESHAVRSDGGTYNNLYCFVITVRDGKVLHLREYLDTKAAQDMIDATALKPPKSAD